MHACTNLRVIGVIIYMTCIVPYMELNDNIAWRGQSGIDVNNIASKAKIEHVIAS